MLDNLDLTLILLPELLSNGLDIFSIEYYSLDTGLNDTL